MTTHPIIDFAQRAALISAIAYETSGKTSQATEWHLRRCIYELGSPIRRAIEEKSDAWRSMFDVIATGLPADRKQELIAEIDKASRSGMFDQPGICIDLAISEAFTALGWGSIPRPTD